jgi:hypothetical protein
MNDALKKVVGLDYQEPKRVGSGPSKIYREDRQ